MTLRADSDGLSRSNSRNTVPGSWPQAATNQQNSTRSMRRSPFSTLATQLWGTPSPRPNLAGKVLNPCESSATRRGGHDNRECGLNSRDQLPSGSNSVSDTQNHRILCGDAETTLATLTASEVDLTVTSPPYFRHRDYGVQGQIGREQTLDDYLHKIREVLCSCSASPMILALASSWSATPTKSRDSCLCRTASPWPQQNSAGPSAMT